jgi:hypothetical protein
MRNVRKSSHKKLFVKKIMRNVRKSSHKKFRRSSSSFDHVKSDLLFRNGIPIRPFSSTPSRKGDPLGTTVLAFSSPYAASLLANPLGIAFVLLMGMSTGLFLLVTDLPGFFALGPSYGDILQRMDSILLLSETLISYEQNGIAILLTNIGNFSPEVLHSFYLSLQELVTVRESLFSNFDDLMNYPEIMFLDRPLLDRIDQNIEELRLGGNNLMSLIRDIEARLNIPESERIPSF